MHIAIINVYSPWMEANQLAFKHQKTHYIFFHRIRLKRSKLISISGEKQFRGFVVQHFWE